MSFTLVIICGIIFKCSKITCTTLNFEIKFLQQYLNFFKICIPFICVIGRDFFIQPNKYFSNV